MRSYFKKIRDILTYYDYEPLIFFVALFDFINLTNNFITIDEWNCNFFQTFDVTRFYDWMPLIYWLTAFLILLFINNRKILTWLIVLHVMQDTVYLVDNIRWLILDIAETPQWFHFRWAIDMFYQLFWALAWYWILFQMKKKELYQRLGL